MAAETILIPTTVVSVASYPDDLGQSTYLLSLRVMITSSGFSALGPLLSSGPNFRADAPKEQRGRGNDNPPFGYHFFQTRRLRTLVKCPANTLRDDIYGII